LNIVGKISQPFVSCSIYTSQHNEVTQKSSDVTQTSSDLTREQMF